MDIGKMLRDMLAGGGTSGMVQQALAGTSATPQPAAGTPPSGGTGGAAAVPAQPQAYTSPPQLMELYTDLLDRQEKKNNINRGIGLIGSSLAFEENRPGIMAAFNNRQGQQSPTDILSTVMELQGKTTALQNKAAQRATLPAIAKQYGLDLQTAQYLFDEGTLDAVIQDLEKPNKQLAEDANGQHSIVDLTDGSVGEPFGAPKKRETEIVEGQNGEKFAVYKDTKERVGGASVVAGQRKTEIVEGQNGEKFTVYSDTKERVAGAPVVAGQRKTEYVDEPGTGGKKLVYSDTKEPVGSGDMAGTGTTTDQQNYTRDEADRKARNMPSRSFTDYLADQRKSVVTNSNLGRDGIDYGDPEKGFAWKRDAEGNVMLGKDRAPIQIPIIGGSAEKEAKDADTMAKAKRGERLQVADTVTANIDRALSGVEALKDTWVPATGLRGFIASSVPGTPQYDVAQTLETVKANLGFDKLQAMRAASPTGAALGPVSDFENKLLQSVMGNLEQGQSHGQFKWNLARVRRIYEGIMTGEFVKDGVPNKAAADAALDEIAQPDQAEKSIEDLLKEYGK